MINIILAGDCMDGMKDMQTGSVDLTITDIPYSAVSRVSNGLRKLDKGMADVQTFDLADFLPEVARVTKGTCIIFCGKEQFSQVYEFFAQQKGNVRPIIWNKTNPSPMNGEYVYLSGVEMGVWFKKKGATFNAFCKNTVFSHPCGRSRVHPTEKNHRLLTELILDNSAPGEIVFDPCAGSGAHLLVAKQNERNYFGFELDPDWHKIAQERITQ
jgi:site-specific DNA-methyltransferase (adenine-specific)